MSAPRIDVHVLTMPHDRPDWSEQLRADLAAAPVRQHWLPGLRDDMGAARAAGYALGQAEYVSWCCPDDRVNPAAFAALAQALDSNPFAPFAWAGEQCTDAHLRPLAPPRLWPQGYNRNLHRNSPAHVHGVVLMRRLLVQPLLPLLRQASGTAGFGADWLLSLLLSNPERDRPPGWQPLHLPIVGRQWRLHGHNAHQRFTQADAGRIRQLAGVQARYLHGAASAAPAEIAPSNSGPPCPSCGPPRPG